MSYSIDKKTGGIVIGGFDKGIAPSPHKGIANMQNVNISTESGEVMCSFSRVQQSTVVLSGQTLNYFSNAGGVDNFEYQGPTYQLKVGMVLNIGTGFTGGSWTAGNYYIISVSGSISNQIITVSKKWNGTGVSGDSGGSATFGTMNLAQPLASATESYFDGTIQQYRYYILDSKGYVWVNDTGTSWSTVAWTPIDLEVITSGNTQMGLAVYCGYVHVLLGAGVLTKETVLFGVNWVQTNLYLNAQGLSPNRHFAITPQTGKLTYTDANFIGTIESSSGTVASGNVNSFSYASYTFSTYSLTVAVPLAGDFPIIGEKITFTSTGTLPSGISANVVYYVTNGTNSVYTPTTGVFSISATQGGAAISLSGGSGTQYFNSYKPDITTGANATDSNGVSTLIFVPQAFTLPYFENTTSLCEIGSTIIVGCKSNNLYPWNTQDISPSTVINLPENNAQNMIAVNNMAYIFAGNKGNIYICNGAIASAVISVPDYCAGIAGTASTYIEPYFTWGGSDYIRGRVYFSIQDQTASKAGMCGGIWSFVPTQNFFAGQDIGNSLRLENTNSYGTLSGLANIIIQNQNQSAIGVQYFTAWTSDVNTPTYGIDTSGTFPNNTAIIESDGIPTGSMLDKKTFERIEYKVSSPLLSGESIALNYRKDLTSAWTSCGTVITDSALSGYYVSNFEFTQWLQIQVQLIPNGTSTYSGNRLVDIKIK